MEPVNATSFLKRRAALDDVPELVVFVARNPCSVRLDNSRRASPLVIVIEEVLVVERVLKPFGRDDGAIGSQYVF